MQYAKWLPSPSAWIDALLLAIPTYLGTVVFSFIFWILFIPFLLAAILTLKFELLFVCLLSFVLLVFGLLWYLALKLIFSVILRLLWHTPPKWIMQSWNWKETVKYFAISALATLPISLQFLYLVSVKTTVEIFFKIDFYLPAGLPEKLIMQNLWLWLVCAALLIHWIPLKR